MAEVGFMKCSMVGLVKIGVIAFARASIGEFVGFRTMWFVEVGAVCLFMQVVMHEFMEVVGWRAGFIDVVVCWFIDVMMCWFVDATACWFIDATTCWFIDGTAWLFIDVMARLFVYVMMCWFVGVAVCLFIDVVLHRFAEVGKGRLIGIVMLGWDETRIELLRGWNIVGWMWGVVCGRWSWVGWCGKHMLVVSAWLIYTS